MSRCSDVVKVRFLGGYQQRTTDKQVINAHKQLISKSIAGPNKLASQLLKK